MIICHTVLTGRKFHDIFIIMDIGRETLMEGHNLEPKNMSAVVKLLGTGAGLLSL